MSPVESPHTMRFYVDSLIEAQEQKTEYIYGGSHIPVRMLNRIKTCECCQHEPTAGECIGLR